jgi:hypothetical protein
MLRAFDPERSQLAADRVRDFLGTLSLGHKILDLRQNHSGEHRAFTRRFTHDTSPHPHAASREVVI